MTLESELKKRLNGLRHTVENTWNGKVEIENRNELTGEEKDQRKQALRDEQAKELRKKKREIKQFLEENKTDFDEIPESEPSTSKEIAEAQRHQGRAAERINGIDDPAALNKAVKSEFKDPTLDAGYKRELWKLSQSRLMNIDDADHTYYKDQLNNLRRKHLLTDNQRGLLRKTEAVEDISPVVTFTTNYLQNALDDKVFSDKITAPETQEELQEALDPVYDKAVKAIGKEINKHKPKSKQNAH